MVQAVSKCLGITVAINKTYIMLINSLRERLQLQTAFFSEFNFSLYIKK